MQVSLRFFQGKKIYEEIPMIIYESIIARHYGWSLDDIRDMDDYDFQAHLQVCFAYESAEKDFDITLAGRGPEKGGSKAKQIMQKKFNPEKRDFE